MRCTSSPCPTSFFFFPLSSCSNIIFSTLSGSDMIPPHCKFDFVIVDEAGQSTEPDSLIPLQRGCTRMVLIGDPLQLPPTAMDTAGMMGKSLFERLMPWAQASHRCCMLREQYRMHPSICSFVSHEYYQDKLQTAEARVKQAEPSYLKRYVRRSGLVWGLDGALTG